ncbi:MAG: hypothetical protein KGJ66_09545 [Alphaproteobacteria bacterium]|nr:hypothetical protein [Alphaproteobacteria bacterium]
MGRAVKNRRKAAQIRTLALAQVRNPALLTIFNGPYANRLTTFIDILAFTRDVVSLSTRPGLIYSIEAVLSRLRNLQSNIDGKRAREGVRHDARMTCFSDSVVLSYATQPGAANRALADAAFIGRVLLAGGYLPRGAITVGKLVHTEKIIFGEALIQAAHEEKSSVITPRVALLPVFHDLVRLQFAGIAEDKSAFVRDRGDGPFVHILGNRWPFIEQERRDRAAQGIAGDAVAEMYDEIRLAMPVRYSDAPHDRARDKIRWVRDYVNDTISEQQLSLGFRVILPGDSEMPAPP